MVRRCAFIRRLHSLTYLSLFAYLILFMSNLRRWPQPLKKSFRSGVPVLRLRRNGTSPRDHRWSGATCLKVSRTRSVRTFARTMRHINIALPSLPHTLEGSLQMCQKHFGCGRNVPMWHKLGGTRSFCRTRPTFRDNTVRVFRIKASFRCLPLSAGVWVKDEHF